MERLTLLHLTVVGSATEPASVEFGANTTIVHGPSDTGKSFMVDAIDFMLGSTALKEVPELAGFSTVLLGLILPNSSQITLARSVNGGSISVYDGDIRTLPLEPSERVLGPKHHATNEDNLSQFFLSQLSFTGRRVRKNAKGQTDSLSFRNLAHLCVVDETQMQAQTSPALTGSYISKTKEISVLRSVLEDDDDSSLTATADPAKSKAHQLARADVIEEMILAVEKRLTDAAPLSEVRSQLDRLNATIDESAASTAHLLDSRAGLARDLGAAQRDLSVRRNRLSDLEALRARFALLSRQYQSDLDRLAMLAEAGTLLGYFQAGTCPFCGAEEEHQHLNEECEGDETFLSESVVAETSKTEALRADLSQTISDVERDAALEAVAIESAVESISATRKQIGRLDEELDPQTSGLRELIELRSRVERVIGLYDQAEELYRIRTEVSGAAKADTASAAARMNLLVLDEFSDEMTDCLRAWGVPEATGVRYDRSEQDLISGGQLRSAHGKGVRAILHAAFTLGLAQYCYERDLPHPGFVVLDSPLITYRPPDLAEDGEGQADNAVANAFYEDVQRRIGCQVIVMENIDPPNGSDPDVSEVPFTKAKNFGRYGFFRGPSSA
ncbi:MAG: hypothetical protein WBA45_16740 [Microthrixaceae bacterium]